MNKVLFSVIVPTLNEEQFLPKLLESLVQQTKKNFEVIIVDGSSKDTTMVKAGLFVNTLPTMSFVNCEKVNPSLQRNLGAKRAKGEWLIFIDADVVLLPHFFDRICEYIRAKSPTFFTTWFRPDSEEAGDAAFTLLANLFVEAGILLNRQIAPGPMTAVTRVAFDMIGGYDTSLTFGEDYDLTRRLIARGFPFTILRETLYEFSLRRVRREGKLKLVTTYARASLQALLTRRTPKHVRNYIMGGQLYKKV